MKIDPVLNRIFDGVIGAPTIIQTKRDFLSDLFPVLNQLNLGFRSMPLFNMTSTFLTRKTIDEIADLDIVENVYIDWPVKIPEIPIGFTVSDFTMHRDVFGFGILQNRRVNFGEKRAEWVTTTESRRFLEADAAERDGITGKDVIVGVVDSDASARAANHRQFMGKSVQRYTVRKAFQTDSNGHGTHVATTIGGSLFQAMPNFYVEGIAPDARMMLVKCLLTPLGMGSTSDCIEGINLAFDKGADVINLSLGSEATDPEEDPFVQAINMLPEDKVVCVASGNEGATKVGSPAIAENSLAIGAMDIRTGMKADFSNSGQELDFIMPGVNIFSGVARETLLDITGGGPEAFSALSGTSMATPHMTGMVALAIDLMKQHNYRPTIDTFREIGKRYGESYTTERGYGPLTYSMIKRYVAENLA